MPLCQRCVQQSQSICAVQELGDHWSGHVLHGLTKIVGPIISCKAVIEQSQAGTSGLAAVQESGDHWSAHFLRRIQGLTKLVGPTISCEAPLSPVNHNVTLAVVPYVEFGLLATDVVRDRLCICAALPWCCSASVLHLSDWAGAPLVWIC